MNKEQIDKLDEKLVELQLKIEEIKKNLILELSYLSSNYQLNANVLLYTISDIRSDLKDLKDLTNE